MHDPSLAASEEPKANTLNEAPATAAAAGMETEAVKEPEGIDPDAEVAVELEMSDAEEEESIRSEHTAESLLEAARALLAREACEIAPDEIRRLRQHFSMLHKQAEATSSEEGAEAAALAAETVAEATEQEFAALIEQARAKRAAWAAEQEAIRADNLVKKNDIIAQINALAEDTDNVNRTFPVYRELQDQFNAVGDVDPQEDTAVWKRFQEARERYSDNLKINKELRDYDFKKNLAEKQVLLEEARHLAEVDDVISAYRRLQELHTKWRQIGPVAKELRDEIWNNFRDASAEVNKRYQALFEARKAREAENESAKKVLCERIESLDYSTLRSFAAWEEMTKTIIGLQEEWRTLGFASKKMNRQLFARFRQSCDAFFTAKAEYYKSTREELARNLEKKTALADRAESLKDSTDWRIATEQFVEMQKEWKTIGTVPKKQSDALWKRFTTACDYFFERKKKEGNSTRQVEVANLKAKREVIGLISALISDEASKESAIDSLRSLQDRWKEIGHVPFREKDKVQEAYCNAVNAVRDHFAIAERSARRNRFEASVAELEGDDNKLFRERERIARALERRRAELRTYENNLGFLSSKSKSGDSLVRDMERRIERLKGDIEEILEKIKLIDSKLS